MAAARRAEDWLIRPLRSRRGVLCQGQEYRIHAVDRGSARPGWVARELFVGANLRGHHEHPVLRIVQLVTGWRNARIYVVRIGSQSSKKAKTASPPLQNVAEALPFTVAAWYVVGSSSLDDTQS